MLSNNDIARTLGKGININPFNNKNVEGASVYLTASKLAWSSKTGACLFTHNKIEIPPNDTAIIITNEIIQLTNRFAATCHARLTLTMKGLSYYATPIKPCYSGKLIIFLQNNTNDQITINVNEKIVTVMFFKLLSNTSISKAVIASPDAYLFSTNKITMDDEQRTIYETPKSHNDSENQKRYDGIKKDKSWILDVLMTFVCSSLFITSIILLLILPPENQNVKDVVFIVSPFAGGGAFTFIYKLMKKYMGK